MNRNAIYSVVAENWKHRHLAWEVAKRDLQELCKGAYLGIGWQLILPFIQISLFLLVLSLLQAESSLLDPDKVLYILSGMIPWSLLTVCLTKNCSLIRDKMEIVKQVIYPVETLPVSSLLVCSPGCCVCLLLFFALSCLFNALTWSFILLPIPICFLSLFLVGSGWLLSLLGVLMKDIREVVSVLMMMCAYLTPVFLSESIVPRPLWTLMQYNPFTHILICFRDVLYRQLHPESWALFTLISLTSFFIGGLFIYRAKLLIREYV